MAELPLDRYIVDVLLPDLVGHDRSASTFLVYLYLWRHSVGRGRPSVEASHQTIASEIGLSKSTVQCAIRRLKRRRRHCLLRPSRWSTANRIHRRAMREAADWVPNRSVGKAS